MPSEFWRGGRSDQSITTRGWFSVKRIVVFEVLMNWVYTRTPPMCKYYSELTLVQFSKSYCEIFYYRKNSAQKNRGQTAIAICPHWDQIIIWAGLSSLSFRLFKGSRITPRTDRCRSVRVAVAAIEGGWVNEVFHETKLRRKVDNTYIVKDACTTNAGRIK